MLKSRSQCFHRMFDYSVPSQNFFEGCVCRFYNGALLSSVNQSKIYWSRKKFVNMFSLNNILILSQFCNSKISTRSVTWDSTLNKVHALLQFFMTFWRVLLMARVFDVYFCWSEFLTCTFVGRSFWRVLLLAEVFDVYFCWPEFHENAGVLLGREQISCDIVSGHMQIMGSC